MMYDVNKTRRLITSPKLSWQHKSRGICGAIQKLNFNEKNEVEMFEALRKTCGTSALSYKQ